MKHGQLQSSSWCTIALTDAEDARVARFGPRSAAGSSVHCKQNTWKHSLLITAGVSTLRLRIWDIQIQVDELLVKLRQAATKASTKLQHVAKQSFSRRVSEVSDDPEFFPRAGLHPSRHIKLVDCGSASPLAQIPRNTHLSHCVYIGSALLVRLRDCLRSEQATFLR